MLVLWLQIEIPTQLGFVALVNKQIEGRRQSLDHKKFTSQGDVPGKGQERGSTMLIKYEEPTVESKK